MSFILIVGAGRVGSAVGRAMLEAGHDVSVLDEDPLSHERLDSGMDTTWEDAGGRVPPGDRVGIDAAREGGLAAGAGKVGWNLARELMSKRHEVTVIESDRSRYLTVEQELEHAIQYGDATELWVLERAGINRADLTIAVTGDEDNLLICQLAKEKYLCERIIARVNNPRNRQYFELLGIQPAVSATDLILRLIEHEVPSYGLVHLLDLRDEQLEIIGVGVSASSPAAGRTVQDVALPDGSLIISILRGGKGFVPTADTVIDPGDEVLLVLDPGLEDRITAQFSTGGESEAA